MASSEHELDAPPWQRFESTLMATSRAMRKVYDQAFSDLGVHLTEALLIAVVDDHGPMAQSELARRLGVGRAALGQMVDSLVSRGLVTRRDDREDKRVRMVVLTLTGRRLATEIVERDLDVRQKLRRGLTKAERSQLARTLLQIQHNLQAISAEQR